MSEIKHKILAQLADVEKNFDVVIPLAVESGSRAWGFASPDSDYDCRFIYVSRPEHYLSVFEQRDTIEFTPDAIYDVGGWDLKKVVLHLVKSNAVMLEWLQSPILYREDEPFRQQLWQLGQEFFNPVSVSWHYLSMARKKVEEIAASEETKIKKYVYALRPLACTAYIRQFGNIPHMEYRRNLARLDLAPELMAEIQQLLAAKAVAVEGAMIPLNKRLLAYFQEECQQAEIWLKTATHSKPQNRALADEVFRRLLHQSWPGRQETNL